MLTSRYLPLIDTPRSVRTTRAPTHTSPTAGGYHVKSLAGKDGFTGCIRSTGHRESTVGISRDSDEDLPAWPLCGQASGVPADIFSHHRGRQRILFSPSALRQVDPFQEKAHLPGGNLLSACLAKHMPHPSRGQMRLVPATIWMGFLSQASRNFTRNSTARS